MGLGWMHRRLGDSRRDRIYANTLFGVLDRKRSCRGIQTTLSERRKHSRHAGHRLVDEAGRDGYDMTISLLVHDLYRPLRHMKETRNIGCDIGSVVVIRICGKRLGHEYTCVINQRVDAIEAI